MLCWSRESWLQRIYKTARGQAQDGVPCGEGGTGVEVSGKGERPREKDGRVEKKED